jgi:excisionase family DNA binding protein
MTEITTRHDGLSVGDAARMLGVSPQTIHHWINAGRLPATRIGERIIRIKPEDVEAQRGPAA